MKRLIALPLILLVILAALLAACGGDDKDNAPAKTSTADTAANASAPAGDPNAYTHPELLVETGQLAALANDPAVAIVDVRKKASYDAGHVPGAVWYDPAKLKDPDDTVHVIREELFSENMGSLGIDNTKKIVAYDDGNGLSATRLWWVDWYYGGQGAVVNGGFAKYQKDGLTVTKDAPAITTVAFKAKVNDQVVCALDYVEKESANPDPNVVILDVRSPAEYSGADVRAAKGGHVPNSVNLDWTRSMTDTQPQVWKSAAELRKQFAEVGVKPGSEVITYCQTGVRAAHSLFTLRLLGYDGLRNFDGSWQEWGNNKDTKVAN
jgi:thiosulfate/3-mercaptopyruvate sulfurtransferase